VDLFSSPTAEYEFPPNTRRLVSETTWVSPKWDENTAIHLNITIENRKLRAFHYYGRLPAPVEPPLLCVYTVG